MRKASVVLLSLFFLFSGCQREEAALYTIGIFQVNDAPTLNDVRRGFIQALEDNGLSNGRGVKLIIENGMGSLPEVQRIAREFVAKKIDMIVALSTPCLQAALHATRNTPIVFSSVANPLLAGAGNSMGYHLANVSGVSSQGPIKESLVFIREVMPRAKRIGTLWTPSELNSEYYLELAREGAREMGLEIVAVPVANSSEVLLAAQTLINKKIDAIYQISDNTINASFEAIGSVAEENAVPLFGGFPPHTRRGACAAMGWDFFDMGYKAGKIAVRVKNGENPKDIPFQYMKDVKLHINLEVAGKQGIEFPEETLKRANEVLGRETSFPNAHRF